MVCLTVYISGTDYQRALISNAYLSLSIISVALFSFMHYGLYVGIGLVDDFPRSDYKFGQVLTNVGAWADFSSGINTGDGIGGLILSILFWVAAAVLVVSLLLILESLFWLSFFVVIAMLYGVFFRALKAVFDKSGKTKGSVTASAIYALRYTFMYAGWLFAVVYLIQILN